MKKGFTLIELMIIIMIIAVLTAMALPMFGVGKANTVKDVGRTEYNWLP